MTLPVILLGLTSAFLLGALFHAFRGGGGWRLLLALFLSALGFTLGQAVGLWFGFILFNIGDLDVAMGAIGSIVTLIIGDWLSRIKPPDKSGV